MVVLTDRRRARTLPWLRLAALLPVSMLIGHEAVFALQFGIGDGLRQAMSAGGHDNYWTAFTVVITALSAGLLVREIARAVRLKSRLRDLARQRVGPATVPDPPATLTTRGAWQAEFRGIWPLLFAVTAVGFTIQENLEHLTAGQAPHGLGSLIAGEHPLALPVLAVVSAAIAAVGALIRWRVRTLEARVAAARVAAGARPRHPRSIAPAREWPAIGAVRAHAWFLVRLLAGRAPPAVA
jgi:hypothetical protein